MSPSLSDQDRLYLKELDQVVYDLFKIVSTHLETRTNDINKTLAYYFEEWLEQLREVREKNPLGKKILPTGKIPNSTLISLLGKDEEELKAIKKAEKDLRLISAEIRHLRHLRPEESSTGIVDENLKHYIDSLFFAKDNHMGSVVADRYIIRKKDGDFLCDNKPLVFRNPKTDYCILFNAIYDTTAGGGEVSYRDLYRDYRVKRGKKPPKGEGPDEVAHKINNLIRNGILRSAKVGDQPLSVQNLAARDRFETIPSVGIRFNNKR